MRGAITGKDVILHSLRIVRLWGLGTYFKCLWAAVSGTPTTFLGVLYPPPRSTGALPAAELPRAARAGSVVLAAAVAGRPPAPLLLARAPTAGSRWRLSK